MFIVKDGDVEDVVDDRRSVEEYSRDFLEIPDEFKNKPNKTNGQNERALSPTGYM